MSLSVFGEDKEGKEGEMENGGDDSDSDEEFGPDFGDLKDGSGDHGDPRQKIQIFEGSVDESESSQKEEEDFGPAPPGLQCEQKHLSMHSCHEQPEERKRTKREGSGERKAKKIRAIGANTKSSLDHQVGEFLETVGLPSIDFYEYSLMHKAQVSHIIASSKTGFVITASTDGVVKFWKFEFHKNNTNLEYVKGFQAHRGEISDMKISDCELFLATVSPKEKNYKLYSVVNFDMISIVSLDITPNKCTFIDSVKRNGGGYVLHPKIAISELENNNIHLYFPNSRLGGTGSSNAPKYTNHRNKVTSIRYLKRNNIVISCDSGGGIEFWDPDTLSLPIGTPSEKVLSFKYKIETDLFELQKSGCRPIGTAVSEDEKLLAIYCSDMKIRIFKINTGKCTMVVDESISVYNLLQGGGGDEGKRYRIDHIEFGVRSRTENEIKDTREIDYQSLCFDETCRYLIYPCILGICVFDLLKNKRVAIIGKLECGKRFLSVGLLQMHGDGDLVTKDPTAVCPQTKCTNSAMICSSLNSNRIYVFSKHLPILENGQVNLERDIFNETPSREDDIERQRLINTENKKQADNKRIAKSVILHTTKGDITLELFGNVAPKACENFSVHCFNKYYDNCVFHRVIKGFMIQTGDPTGDGTGGDSIWGGSFEDEFSSTIRHDQPFMLSMANAGPNTNSSQFFITTVPCPWLDDVHTIFGKVTQGKEYVQEIELVPTNRHDRPINDVYITSTTVNF